MTTFPRTIKLGLGKDFSEDCFNIDVAASATGDAVLDFRVAPFLSSEKALPTRRFGTVTLKKNSFREILAPGVLQQVDDFQAFMTSCLDLLVVGGVMKITVPYDLSFGAWADPRNRRAFNELTFASYIDDQGHAAGSMHCFEMVSLDYIPGQIAMELQAKEIPAPEIARYPRAIDGLSVQLQKVVDRKAVATPASAQDTSLPRTASGPQAFAGSWSQLKDRFCIWIVTPENYIHTRAFYEPAVSLSSAFRQLGGSAPITTQPAEWKGRIPIIYGANVLTKDIAEKLPRGSVIFNMEQATTDSVWMSSNYFAFLKTFAVLESSAANLERLAGVGIDHAQLLQLGYCPEWTCIEPEPVQDIDVLFYGSMNERRRAILLALHERGLKIKHLFGVYGAERDAAIARAKVVMNIHAKPNWVFETVRVLYLLANRTCVLTEAEGDDDEAEAYRGGLAMAAYDDLVERCVELVANEEERRRLADTGFELVKRRSQAQILSEALGI
ncbi:glycosyltransferase family protein [Shinella zoogloeoides]|uniref:glycosyltransferase family protein n=1 Tax=Shinella zoogloeoides TaxID=352475 RepID=UPI000E649093|nr:glycosyltransferase family 1 protein [Shinella zoogloeoides]